MTFSFLSFPTNRNKFHNWDCHDLVNEMKLNPTQWHLQENHCFLNKRENSTGRYLLTFALAFSSWLKCRSDVWIWSQHLWKDKNHNLMMVEQEAERSKGLIALTPAPACLSLDILRKQKKKKWMLFHHDYSFSQSNAIQTDWENLSCFNTSLAKPWNLYKL